MKHKCPVKNCQRVISTKLLMCAGHWRLVPGDLQAKVWDTYRKSQGSARHFQAMMDAIRAVDNLIASQSSASVTVLPQQSPNPPIH